MNWGTILGTIARRWRSWVRYTLWAIENINFAILYFWKRWFDFQFQLTGPTHGKQLSSCFSLTLSPATVPSSSADPSQKHKTTNLLSSKRLLLFDRTIQPTSFNHAAVSCFIDNANAHSVSPFLAAIAVCVSWLSWMRLIGGASGTLDWKAASKFDWSKKWD